MGGRVITVTENDTVYALDAATGAVAWRTHLGAPVDSSTLPCGNIVPTSGITATPTEDPATVKHVADVFSEKYGADRVKEYYPNLNAAVEVPLT